MEFVVDPEPEVLSKGLIGKMVKNDTLMMKSQWERYRSHIPEAMFDMLKNESSGRIGLYLLSNGKLQMRLAACDRESPFIFWTEGGEDPPEEVWSSEVNFDEDFLEWTVTIKCRAGEESYTGKLFLLHNGRVEAGFPVILVESTQQRVHYEDLEENLSNFTDAQASILKRLKAAMEVKRQQIIDLMDVSTLGVSKSGK